MTNNFIITFQQAYGTGYSMNTLRNEESHMNIVIGTHAKLPILDYILQNNGFKI